QVGEHHAGAHGRGEGGAGQFARVADRARRQGTRLVRDGGEIALGERGARREVAARDQDGHPGGAGISPDQQDGGDADERDGGEATGEDGIGPGRAALPGRAQRRIGAEIVVARMAGNVARTAGNAEQASHAVTLSAWKRLAHRGNRGLGTTAGLWTTPACAEAFAGRAGKIRRSPGGSPGDRDGNPGQATDVLVELEVLLDVALLDEDEPESEPDEEPLDEEPLSDLPVSPAGTAPPRLSVR